MKPHYVLIDFESLPLKSLALVKGEEFHVKVFLGPNNTNVPRGLVLDLHEMAGRGDYIVLDAPGKNALDFYITFYLGELASKSPDAAFSVVSKDKGFDSLLKHLTARGIHCKRVTALEQIAGAPLSAQPKKVAVAKPAAAAQTPSVDSLVKIVVNDLIKRKIAKPRSTKTLMNTIRNTCGKDCPQSMIDRVLSTLVKRGYLKIDGTKVTYSLPALLP